MRLGAQGSLSGVQLGFGRGEMGSKWKMCLLPPLPLSVCSQTERLCSQLGGGDANEA